MDNNGLLLHDKNGKLVFDNGYKVLVFIENYGGNDVVAFSPHDVIEHIRRLLPRLRRRIARLDPGSGCRGGAGRRPRG